MAHFDQDANGFPVLFAEPPHRELPEIVTPDATSGPAEWGRYSDAVRECSRSFDNPQEGDVREFLNARARTPERVDAPAFHEAVKRQRMADLVDIVDHHMRRDGSLPRGSRKVRVQAPKGYMRRALRQSSPEDLAHLHHRLTSIGHNDDRVSEYLSSRVGEDSWGQASVIEVQAADTEFDGLLFDDFQGPDDDETAEIIEAIRNMPPPVVNVFVDTKEKS